MSGNRAIELKSHITTEIAKHEAVFSSALEDKQLSTIEQANIKKSLDAIKSSFSEISKHPEELKLLNEELNTIITQRGLEKCLFCGNTNEELNNAQEDVFLSLETKIQGYHDEINKLESDICFYKRGENKKGRRLVKQCKKTLNDLEKVLRKNKRLNRRIARGRTKVEVRSPLHIKTMFAKMDRDIKNVKDELGQLMTGDTPGTRKFIGPDVLNNPLSGNEGPKKVPVGKELTKYCTQGSKYSGGGSMIGKRGEIVDNEVAPRLDANVTNGKGTNIISGGLKLGALVANGVMAWNIAKSVRSLRGADSAGTKAAVGKILLNAGGIAALNFVDPEKTISHIKDARGFVTGNSSGSGTGRGGKGAIDITRSVSAIKNKEESPESKEQVHGPMIVGAALVGLNHKQARIPGIFTCVGDSITGVNCDKLLAYYKDTYGNNIKALNEYTSYVTALEQMQKHDPSLVKKIMNAKGVTANDFDRPELADKMIGTRIVADLAVAKHVTESIMRTQLQNQFESTYPAVVKVLGAQQTKLIDGIIGMSAEQQQDILEGKIVFGIENGKLYMSSSKEKIFIDLTNMSISTMGADGDSLCPLRFINETDLLYWAYHTAQIINQHRNKYMVEQPFFYKKKRGGRGHDMHASTGGRSLFNPFSRTGGSSEEVLGGSWFEGLDKSSPSIYKQFNGYVNYMNRLNIWKNIDSDRYIKETLRPEFERLYPNINNDPNYNKMIDEMVNHHFGIYSVRGDNESLLFSTIYTQKEKIIKFVRESYSSLSTFTQTKYTALSTWIGDKAQLVYDGGEWFWTHPDSPKVKLVDRVKKQWNNKSAIRQNIVTQAGLDWNKLKNFTFSQLPQGIGALLVNTLAGIGIFMQQIAIGGYNIAKSYL